MKRIFAAVLLCLLLCGCANEPKTKTIWLLTSSETYMDPQAVTKTEYVYDSEGYLRKEVLSYSGYIQDQKVVARWDGWGNATMLVSARFLSSSFDQFSGLFSSSTAVPELIGTGPYYSSYISSLPNCEVRKYNERGQLMYVATASPGTRLEDGNYAYDSLSYQTVYRYDDTGNMISLYMPNAGSGSALFYTYNYEDGQRTETRTYRIPDSVGLGPEHLSESSLSRHLVETTVHTYDIKGRLLRDTAKSATGSETVITYEYYTDPDTGNTTCIGYRKDGQTRITVTDPHGNVIRTESDTGSDILITTYTYTSIQIPAGSPRQGR